MAAILVEMSTAKVDGRLQPCGGHTPRRGLGGDPPSLC
jgi:hypothetical protein